MGLAPDRTPVEPVPRALSTETVKRKAALNLGKVLVLDPEMVVVGPAAGLAEAVDLAVGLVAVDPAVVKVVNNTRH